jgi:hypothetical protein
VAAEPTTKQKAWVLFDRIVSDVAPNREFTNPWVSSDDGRLSYEPDLQTLSKLLGVPLLLGANTTSGVPALALDVWLSYELRRAGFDPDQTWPRAEHPRILPVPIAKLLKGLSGKEQAQLRARITKDGAISGVTSASANILGKNYLKQVDVIMTDWHTGPELLISTKRMDSSYGKNAANRIEESYGDAKNLRLRHPLAALGFVFALRSDILQKEPATYEWLADLLAKLGQEDDAYHATCLIMMEYADAVPAPANGGDDPENRLASAMDQEAEPAEEPAQLPQNDVDKALAELPTVLIRHEAMPVQLNPSRFLAIMVNHVLDTTPVTLHRAARERRRKPRARRGPS